MHRLSTTFILVKPSGRVLVQLRDDGGGKQIEYPNMWGFPGGGIENGETPVQAVVREIQEETNIAIDPSSLVHLLTYDHVEGATDCVFLSYVPEHTAAEVNEGLDMKWLSFDEVSKLELAFNQEKILSVLRNHLEKL